MELRTVRYFVAVADAGSVNAAAQRLHLTQPSLARQLHRLERRLNLTLLEPRGGRLVLTSAGRSFLPHARALLGRAEAAEAVVADLAAGRPPAMAVSAGSLAVNTILAPYLAALDPDEVCPTVFAESSPDFARLDSDVDLVIGAAPPRPGLERLLLARIPVLAYARPDHALAGRASVEIAELADQPLLTTGTGSDVRHRLGAVLLIAGLVPPSITEVCSGRLAQALAASGRGVAVITDPPRFDLLPIGVLDPDGRPVVVDLYAGWRPGHHAAEAIQTLARRLRTVAAGDQVDRPTPAGQAESAA